MVGKKELSGRNVFLRRKRLYGMDVVSWDLEDRFFKKKEKEMHDLPLPECYISRGRAASERISPDNPREVQEKKKQIKQIAEARAVHRLWML